jgi:cobalt-zinc-cadmium efflux system outer membrane protein
MDVKECEAMRAWSLVGRRVGAMLLWLAVPATAAAQTPAAPAARVSMADAVRMALEHNHQLASQRLNVDISRADEITAALKPNPVFSSVNSSFPVFSPSQLTLDNAAHNQNYVESLSYLFERGGKREKRTLVARDTTDVVAKTAVDAERQLIFQTQQAFINVLLAKSTLDLAREDLKNFSDVVELNRQRMIAGDLAEAEFAKISLQKLQFEQDASSSEVALLQAKAALRLNVGFEAVADDFDVEGDLAYAKSPIALDDLKREALTTRPDLLAAQRTLKLMQDTQALAYANRARDLTGEVEYDRAGDFNALGFGVSIELPFHDRNQGNIAHSQSAVRQAIESEIQTRTSVLTDVVSAYAAFQTNEKLVALYQSGYLDQARQSLETTQYVFQRGSGSLLDLLDAERTYRATELAFRQALAAYMTSAQQINFAVGKQVVQ